MSCMPMREAVQSEHQIVGKYKLGKVLGAGDFDCRIRICTHVITGLEYAVRIYSKKTLAEHPAMWDQIQDSIQVMRTLPKHEHVIEMVECFETEQSLYILMQFVAGNSLLKVYRTGEITNTVSFSRTKMLFAQIVWGMHLLHSSNIVHQGLAPDHVIANDGNLLKIGFLVSCKSVPRGTRLNVIRGTTHTVAPEVLQRKPYDPYTADMWSIGIVLYFMLSGGRYPFDGANTAGHILKNDYRPLNPNLPEDAKDIVLKLLKPRPDERMTMDQLLEHPFFVTANAEAILKVENITAVMSPRPEVSEEDAKTTRSYVSATINEDGVSIRLPKGLDESVEAAYIIQHTWRLTRSLKQLLKSGKKGAKEITSEDLFVSTRSNAEANKSAVKREVEREPAAKIGGFSAHSPRAQGTGSAQSQHPLLRQPPAIGIVEPFTPVQPNMPPSQRQGSGGRAPSPRHGSIGRGGQLGLIPLMPSTGTLSVGGSHSQLPPASPMLFRGASTLGRFDRSMSQADGNTGGRPAFRPEESAALGDILPHHHPSIAGDFHHHHHHGSDGISSFDMRNCYQCPECGRLPPPRVLGGKPPYETKTKYIIGKDGKAGKFEDKKEVPVLPLLSPKAPLKSGSIGGHSTGSSNSHRQLSFAGGTKRTSTFASSGIMVPMAPSRQ